MDLQNTEHVKVGNRNIVKIVSGGVLLWGRPYKWEKYSLNKLEFLAGITPFAPASEVIEYYPDYHDFEVRREGSSENLYGRRKPTRSNMVGIVKSPYKTRYPKDGILGDYYYKFIA